VGNVVAVSTSSQPNRLSAFAVTAPGIETICATELRGLGIDAIVEDGGVSWNADLESVARANLWSRTASRILVRVAEFKAKAFFELELHAKRIRWEQFVGDETSVAFRVTCRKSKLYHSDAVAERLAQSVKRRIPNVEFSSDASADDSPASDATQLFVVRVLRDVCTISADSSGALLHFRGYRQALAKAPLRETLAAAMLLAAEWRGDIALADPMCGSGTIPIEAALIARRIAPGRSRHFAFQRWPDAKRANWSKLLDEARSAELPRSPVSIVGADRDAGAIDAARANAERAGVSGDVSFVQQPISALRLETTSAVIINPPYGVRVGETPDLKNLYAQIGNVLRKQPAHWVFGMLSADPNLERQTRLMLQERFRTKNGGIPVRFVTAARAESTI
jgi:putative N6-adenine-specific DNA methylase